MDRPEFRRYWGEGEVEYLPGILKEGEVVKYVVDPWLDGVGDGLLVATDSRLLFLDKSRSGVAKKEFSYDKITYVSYKKDAVFGKVFLFEDGYRSVFESLDHSEAEGFARYITWFIQQELGVDVSKKGREDRVAAEQPMSMATGSGQGSRSPSTHPHLASPPDSAFSGPLDQQALPGGGAAGDIESLSESQEAVQEPDSVSASASTKLGYSRDRLQDRWEELDVSFSLRLNDDGTSAVMGSLPEDHSGKIILVFYGKGDEVHRAHLSVFFSRQKPSTTATGVLLLTVLLGQAFPEWEGASDWVTDTLVELTRRAKSQTEAPEESIERETPAGVPAVVTLTYYDVLGSAYLVIEPR